MKYAGVFGTAVLLICLTLVSARPNSNIKWNDENFKGKCGYEGCPDTPKDKLNIHLVPHTHDDVGWLKTVDQYYYGAKPLVQKAGVEFILDSVIAELIKDPLKRFIYVESAFFFKWWPQQTKDLQNEVIKLVNEGRLEFIGGAWSMNDEATTHYQSLIDQFAYGLRKLNDTFGKCGRPRVGWQIDPFGHSKEMASIFAQMGFDGLFFARLDWRDKTERLQKKAAEMLWHSSLSLEKDSDLFTGILRNHYSAPPGFCFDYLCNDEPIIDDKDSTDYNAKKRLDVFYEYITNMTKLYATNNLMIPMGDDFNYQDAGMYYKNMDKLIKLSTDRKVDNKEVNIFYSTPSCYLKSLNEADKKDWPVENNDFFPYATDIHTYWSGYFSSRPTLKGYERYANNILQVCKKFLAVTTKKPNDNLNLLSEAMGIMQHHDAITGTEKQHVADDYSFILHNAIAGCDKEISKTLTDLLKVDPETFGRLEFVPCHKLNETQCEISEKSNTFMVTILNPTSFETNEYIRIPVVDNETYEIKSSDGRPIQNELVTIPLQVRNVTGQLSKAKYELLFKAHVNDISSYYINNLGISSGQSNKIERINIDSNTNKDKEEEEPKDFEIENKKLKLHFKNHLLSKIELKDSQEQIDFNQQLMYYEGAAGNNSPPFKDRSSGAYIFRPTKLIPISDKIETSIFKGELYSEVRQVYNKWISQIIRLYIDDSHIEFNWLIGPIPVTDKIGKEVISRIQTNIKSDDIFYTDSNGREMVKRKLNEDSKEQEKIPANYYPITTKLAIEDDKYRMAILTDRAQGGSCLESGQCEILLHRRLLRDDAFGVGEALNDTTVARGQLNVVVMKNEPAKSLTYERKLQLRKALPPLSVFSSLKNIDFQTWQLLDHENTAKLLDTSMLPNNVNLLTFEPITGNRILMRFENYFEKEPNDGKTEQFNIEKMLKPFNVKKFDETTLDGNQLLADTKRMQWQTNENENVNETNVIKRIHFEGKNERTLKEFDIELKPMQIRTFVATL